MAFSRIWLKPFLSQQLSINPFHLLVYAHAHRYNKYEIWKGHR